MVSTNMNVYATQDGVVNTAISTSMTVPQILAITTGSVQILSTALSVNVVTGLAVHIVRLTLTLATMSLTKTVKTEVCVRCIRKPILMSLVHCVFVLLGLLDGTVKRKRMCVTKAPANMENVNKFQLGGLNAPVNMGS